MSAIATTISKVVVPAKNLKYEAVSAEVVPKPKTVARRKKLVKISKLEMISENIFTNNDLGKAILVSVSSLEPRYFAKLLKHSDGSAI